MVDVGIGRMVFNGIHQGMFNGVYMLGFVDLNGNTIVDDVFLLVTIQECESMMFLEVNICALKAPPPCISHSMDYLH